MGLIHKNYGQPGQLSQNMAYKNWVKNMDLRKEVFHNNAQRDLKVNLTYSKCVMTLFGNISLTIIGEIFSFGFNFFSLYNIAAKGFRRA